MERVTDGGLDRSPQPTRPLRARVTGRERHLRGAGCDRRACIRRPGASCHHRRRVLARRLRTHKSPAIDLRDAFDQVAPFIDAARFVTDVGLLTDRADRHRQQQAQMERRPTIQLLVEHQSVPDLFRGRRKHHRRRDRYRRRRDHERDQIQRGAARSPSTKLIDDVTCFVHRKRHSTRRASTKRTRRKSKLLVRKNCGYANATMQNLRVLDFSGSEPLFELPPSSGRRRSKARHSSRRSDRAPLGFDLATLVSA